MLEEVMADSRKTEDDAIAAEEDSQTAYENFMKGAKATANEDLTLSNSDLKATLRNLEGLHETLGDLKASCDFILKNFDARQQAREALKEAKAILSGLRE